MKKKRHLVFKNFTGPDSVRKKKRICRWKFFFWFERFRKEPAAKINEHKRKSTDPFNDIPCISTCRSLVRPGPAAPELSELVSSPTTVKSL